MPIKTKAAEMEVSTANRILWGEHRRAIRLQTTTEPVLPSRAPYSLRHPGLLGSTPTSAPSAPRRATICGPWDERAKPSEQRRALSTRARCRSLIRNGLPGAAREGMAGAGKARNELAATMRGQLGGILRPSTDSRRHVAATSPTAEE